MILAQTLLILTKTIPMVKGGGMLVIPKFNPDDNTDGITDYYDYYYTNVPSCGLCGFTIPSTENSGFLLSRALDFAR